jgi:hypothetical protein
MFKRATLISVAAIAALLGSGIATATAASDHSKKKITHASKPVARTAARRGAPSSTPAQPRSTYTSY